MDIFKGTRSICSRFWVQITTTCNWISFTKAPTANWPGARIGAKR